MNNVNVNDAIIAGTSIFGIFGTATVKIHGNLTNAVYNANYPVTKPVSTVSIVIPAFNEEELIERTLRSILTQNIIRKHRDYFECIVVDNESRDRTAEIAKQYCQVISAPRGKLNARDAGIKHAVGNVIVSCDADCYYPPNYLNLLLRHFYKEGVVAVQGVSLEEGNLLYKVAATWVNTISHSIGKRLHGASSAFLRSSYFKVGGFDLSTNQFDIEDIMAEEEVAFYLRLKQLGNIVFDLQACCFHIQRGLHGNVAKELRLTDKRSLEIARGERF